VASIFDFTLDRFSFKVDSFLRICGGAESWESRSDTEWPSLPRAAFMAGTARSSAWYCSMDREIPCGGVSSPMPALPAPDQDPITDLLARFQLSRRFVIVVLTNVDEAHVLELRDGGPSLGRQLFRNVSELETCGGRAARHEQHTSQNGFPSASWPAAPPEDSAVLAFFKDFDGTTSSSSSESLSDAARFFESFPIVRLLAAHNARGAGKTKRFSLTFCSKPRGLGIQSGRQFFDLSRSGFHVRRLASDDAKPSQTRGLDAIRQTPKHVTYNHS
jgi:hypothetical protein